MNKGVDHTQALTIPLPALTILFITYYYLVRAVRFEQLAFSFG